jgi:BirA family biotin operon repressor/biotin-[acetyl-CoA-carboxylase] ligase
MRAVAAQSNWRVSRFPILESTNDLALAWIRSNLTSAGDVVVAAEQTGGRGRPGRQWHSPKGALLFTAVLPFYPHRVGWTSLAAGVAVAQACRDFGAPAGVKWPNDVVLHERKLAGILVEANSTGLVAVGIGMNVTNPVPEELNNGYRAARLADFVPNVTVDDALEAVLTRLAETWDLLAAPDLNPLRRLWSEFDTTIGRKLRWSHENLFGTAEGVIESGALRIRTEEGALLTASVGEVGFVN